MWCHNPENHNSRDVFKIFFILYITHFCVKHYHEASWLTFDSQLQLHSMRNYKIIMKQCSQNLYLFYVRIPRLCKLLILTYTIQQTCLLIYVQIHVWWMRRRAGIPFKTIQCCKPPSAAMAQVHPDNNYSFLRCFHCKRVKIIKYDIRISCLTVILASTTCNN